MHCQACGFENASSIKFCGECGAPLKLKCPSCGFANALGIKFCGECGKPLAEAAKPGAPREPRSYTPKHLAEKILSSRSALEGERKQVTVLFADVKGSSSFLLTSRCRAARDASACYSEDTERRSRGPRGLSEGRCSCRIAARSD